MHFEVGKQAESLSVCVCVVTLHEMPMIGLPVVVGTGDRNGVRLGALGVSWSLVSVYGGYTLLASCCVGRVLLVKLVLIDAWGVVDRFGVHLQMDALGFPLLSWPSRWSVHGRKGVAVKVRYIPMYLSPHWQGTLRSRQPHHGEKEWGKSLSSEKSETALIDKCLPVSRMLLIT